MRTKEDILKHNYIIEHLEKAALKTKELIILSSFCFDAKLWNIKPVFQFPVKNDFGTFYFFDLYYPAINLIIEVDEEHHETDSEKENDKLKEKKAKETLNCSFYRISYHEQYGNVGEQIENVKVKITELIHSLGIENTSWKENQFDPAEYLKNQTKTIIVSISPKNKIQNLNEMPLQLNSNILNTDGINVIYLTGATGTVANVFKVNSNDWNLNQGNSTHHGKEDFENPIISSGSTFFKGTSNIQFSPDLELLRQKKR